METPSKILQKPTDPSLREADIVEGKKTIYLVNVYDQTT